MSRKPDLGLSCQGERDVKGRWRKGVSGNPAGPPKGTRHYATRAAETLLDGQAERLTAKCIELALNGDVIALRLAMERILAPRRERPVSFDLPALETAEDLAKVTAALLQAVAAGEITVGEAAALAKLIETLRTAAAETGAGTPEANLREMLRREAEAFGRLSKAPNGADTGKEEP